MIATNGEVARKLVKDYGPNALVIHHPKPSDYSINNLNTFFSDFGVRFKNDSIISLENEVKKLFEKEGVKDEFKEALMMRAIQIQELAVYSRHMNS
jgi:exoribonuclease R